MSEQHHRRSQPSEWATGGILFAAALLLLIGTFQIIGGLSAIIDDNFYVVGHHYAFNLDTTACASTTAGYRVRSSAMPISSSSEPAITTSTATLRGSLCVASPDGL